MALEKESIVLISSVIAASISPFVALKTISYSGE